jgi:mannan endo-1,4-beta-mannosidase
MAVHDRMIPARPAHLIPAATAWLLLAVLASAPVRGAYDRAADPAASADTRAVLRYLGEVADSDQVLSGQFRYDEGEGGDCVSIHRATGKWPAVLEHYFFLAGYSPPPGTDEKNDADNIARRQKMLEYWQQGGLVSIWAKLLVRHSHVRSAPGDWADVWKPGTPKNNALKEHFDRFYVPHLKWLQERGVVLIFRPYNEEAVYFRDIGDENMRKLWVWTFDYFTRTHGLHNLIWFFSGNREVTDAFFARYPGDTYVDMVGFSDYTPDKPNPAIVKSYELLRARLPHKVFALAEEGWDDKEKRTGIRDAREIIAMIRQQMPRTAYWLSWSQYWSPAQQNHCAELYADPWVLDRSEVKWSRDRR